MDLLEPDDELLTFHEDIIKYLREQNLLEGEDEQFVQDVSNFKEEQVREILEELLQKFERNQKLKEDYEARVKAHNQYPLFDLKEVLPDFHMDEAMYDALTFRETLIIQRLVGEDELVPEAVGGLCLDIQKALGKPPEKRLCCDIDTRLARVMRTKGDVDTIPISDLENHEDISNCENGNDDLGPLEDDLETQSGRSLSKFLVHLSSQFDYDGCNAGSSITTWVDWNFHTLEEARKEFFKKKVTKLVEKIEKVIKNTSYASEDKLASVSKMQSETQDGLAKASFTSAKGRKLSRAQKSSRTSALKTSRASVAASTKSSRTSAIKGSQSKRIGGASKSSIANEQMQAKSSVVNDLIKKKSSAANDMIQAKSSMANDMIKKKHSVVDDIVKAISSAAIDIIQAKSGAADDAIQAKSSAANNVIQAKSSAANDMIQAKSSAANDMIQAKSSAVNDMIQAKSSAANDMIQAKSSAVNDMIHAKSSAANDMIQAKSSAANDMIQAKSSIRSQGKIGRQTSSRPVSGKTSLQVRRLSLASGSIGDGSKPRIKQSIEAKFSHGSRHKSSGSTVSAQQRQSKGSSARDVSGPEGVENEVEKELVEEMVTASKNLYVGLLKGYYYVKHVSSEENVDDRKFYSLLKTKFYISEGANFILQRYLAKTIYIGTFELSAMYINGDMCRNIYNCTGPESQFINNKRIDTCRIYRTIIEECGIEHHCMTVLTLQGQIVTQTWEESNYLLQINPLLDVDNYKPPANEKILLKHAWESDMQLMSKYLDEKVANEIKIKSYMIDHPEFRNMVNDYIHTILLLKPEDIIDFTISHFISFAPQFMPANDYFER